MSNNQLANINEIAFTLACGSTKFTYELSVGKDGNLNLVNKDINTLDLELIEHFKNAVKMIKGDAAGNNYKKVIIKIEQANEGASHFKQWLSMGKLRAPSLPKAFTKDKRGAFWNESLTIVPDLVGWTDTKTKFEQFLGKAHTNGARGICGKELTKEHLDNPSDTLVVVTDKKKICAF